MNKQQALNDLIKPLSEEQENQKLTKIIVLKQITLMRINHNINIEENDFKVKLQLIYEECQDLTNKQFIQNCKILSKKDLFGKIPPAFKFKQPLNKEEAPWMNY